VRVRQSLNDQRFLRPTAILAPRVFRFGIKIGVSIPCQRATSCEWTGADASRLSSFFFGDDRHTEGSSQLHAA
jgi:hypothetical protein